MAGCCICCSKAVLIICNIISMILGVGLIAVGSIILAGQGIIEQLLSQLVSGLPGAVNVDLGILLGDVAIALLIVGAVVFLLSIFGCCGASCNSKFMLVMYSVVVSIILLTELVVVILVVTMKEHVDNFLQSGLNKTIVDSYKGTMAVDTVSLAWNVAQISLKCCGVNNYTDYQYATHWNKTLSLLDPLVLPNGTEIRGTISLPFPITCCKINSTITQLANIEPQTIMNCILAPTIENANIHQGCYKAVETAIGSQSGITIGVVCGILAVQLVLVIFACCVCCSKRGEDDDSKVSPI